MSAVMSDQVTNNVAEFFSPGPGERLRAARLSMGYDLAKIASELHLTSAVVEALEADEFPDVGARVFVRGYLRNYARIVGMPVDSILRQFDEKWPDEGTRQTVVRRSPTLPADGGPGRGLAGLMSWLLVLGLLGLFLVWWRGYLDGLVPEQMRAAGVMERVAPGGDESLPAGFVATPDPVFADGSLRLPAPPADLPLESVEASGPAAVPPADANSLVLPAAPSAAPYSASDESPDASAATPAAEPADGKPEVVLTFSAPCWVDVRDSERQFKLFGEMPAGTRKVLGGTPPYKLVIGNAQAVTISVGGEPLDLAQYANGNVARFTLDP